MNYKINFFIKMYNQKFINRSFINCIVAYTDIREIYIYSMYLVLSALMLILFDFSYLSRHFSSLFISSSESITLSPGTQVESVVSSA